MYNYDAGWLLYCDELVVLMLPGWEDSKGVRIRGLIAQKLGNSPIKGKLCCK